MRKHCHPPACSTRLHLALAYGSLLTTSGCASAPPGPRGPLLGPGFDVGSDFSYAYGAGRATFTDGTSTSGGADILGPNLPLFPRRLETRASPVRWADIGAEIGWLGGGVDALFGLPATADGPLAVNLAAGIDSGGPGPFKDTNALRSRWVRLEAYPELPSRVGMRRLVLAAALHAGTFYHELPDPRPDPGFCDTYCPDVIGTIRRESRIETSVGVFFRNGPASALFTASPYFVVDAGSPQAPNDGEAFTSYRQGWGVVFVLRGALGHHR